MVQELLPLFPDALTTPQAVACLVALCAGVFLWLIGSRWSRGIVTLAAVAIGALLGMYVPRWQLWPVNSMAMAVLGAVGFGVSAYLVERLWMGLTLGFALACWATLGTWMHQRPFDFVWQERLAWQVQHMTPPEHARDIYIRLPLEVQDVLPYATGAAMLSGLAIAFLWPRLGRAFGMSIAGVTLILLCGLALVSTRRPDWLQHIPAPPVTQAGILVGLVMAGLLAQWPFMGRRISKQEELARQQQEQQSAAASSPAPHPIDRQLAKVFN